jgi:hypothetical protein
MCRLDRAGVSEQSPKASVASSTLQFIIAFLIAAIVNFAD